MLIITTWSRFHKNLITIDSHSVWKTLNQKYVSLKLPLQYLPMWTLGCISYLKSMKRPCLKKITNMPKSVQLKSRSFLPLQILQFCDADLYPCPWVAVFSVTSVKPRRIITVNIFILIYWCWLNAVTAVLNYYQHHYGAGMAQWWEHLPPTNVAWVRFPDIWHMISG